MSVKCLQERKNMLITFITKVSMMARAEVQVRTFRESEENVTAWNPGKYRTLVSYLSAIDNKHVVHL